MRSKKIIQLLLILITGFYNLPLFWAEWNEEAFKLYTERVTDICLKKYKSDTTIYENATYKRAEEYKVENTSPETWEVTYTNASKLSLAAFDSAKEIFNTTISNMYKCSILWVQTKQLEIVKELIWRDKTWYIKNEIGPKIESRISKNEMSIQSLKCNDSPKQKWRDIKTDVLKETTYETCKYVMYIEYLKTYYNNTENILNIDKKSDDVSQKFPIEYIAQTIASANARFTEEKERVMELQPMVFSAYVEYENNYLTHLYLELIKTDFSIIRSRWNAAISPINQVVYKISNAMKK